MVAIHLQVVNFGNQAVDLNISIAELPTGIKKSGSKQMVLTSSSPLDENSFQQPEKVSARTESVSD
jgi:alpha-N-arabinofuranosidase